MTFQWPYVLLALPFVLAGLFALFASTQRARARLLGHFASTRLLPILLVSYSPALRLFKNLLIVGGVIMAVVALARPQWGYDWQENHQRGVDVVFVLDTSRSMLTPDVSPSRLERAKLAIYDVVQKMPGNRVGLVAFAGDAFLQCPLTLDYDAFRQTLDAVDTNTIARGGTDIAVGLDAAATALEKSGNHKIIVLITDGEDLEAQGVAEAKTLADQGVTIYTVGVGTPQGDIIPVRDNLGKASFVRDQRGEMVKSRLDSTTLSDIATATHGFYQPLGPTGDGLMHVYEDGIKKIPEQSQSSKMSRLPIERFQWPLAAGTLLLMFELLVGTRRPNWRRRSTPMVNLAEPPPLVSVKPTTGEAKPTAKATQASSVLVNTVLLALFLLSIPSTHAADNTTANVPIPSTIPTTTAPEPTPVSGANISASPKAAQALFENGNYADAAEAYGRAADAAPNDGRFRYNQGESLYRNKDYEGAAQAFTKSLSISDLTLQQQAYYNLGNSHFRLGQGQMKDDPKQTEATWNDAIKDFQNALDLNPQDADARYNLDWVKQQLEALKKQQQQQKQQNQQQNKDNSSQDKQDQQQNQSQNQQNQNNSQQDQQNQQSQNNQQGQNNQQSNKQNFSDPKNQSNQQDQANQQNSSGQQNGKQQADSKNPNGSQKQANQQDGKNGDQKQAQNSAGQQPKPSTGTDKKSSDTQQAQNGQQKNGDKTQPNGTGQGKEPNGQKTGQQTANSSPNAGQPASGNSGDATANGAMVVGVMSREEAMQLLNSLKSNERKLPASRLQAPAQNTSNSDQTFKDW